MIAEHRIGPKRRIDLRQDLENFLCIDDIHSAGAVELVAEENHEVRLTGVYSVHNTLHVGGADDRSHMEIAHFHQAQRRGQPPFRGEVIMDSPDISGVDYTADRQKNGDSDGKHHKKNGQDIIVP